MWRLSSRPAHRAEHERLLRTARKCVVADAAAGSGGGCALEASLRDAYGHDPKFGFLKPSHPLHGYYCALRTLPPGHLDQLVRLAEAEAAATQPINVAALAAALASLPTDDARDQHVGQTVYPAVAAWHPSHAPKLTGMLLALPRAKLLPLLASAKTFKAVVDEALDTLLAARVEENDGDEDA